MLSNSQGNAPLTELQIKELSDLEARVARTQKQAERITELVLKRENSKVIILSDTCIAYLMEHYAWVTEQAVCVGREMNIDYFKKGKLQEGEGIKLLSDVDGVEYIKNTVRLYNDFLTGEPDVIKGIDIYMADLNYDTKLSWDYPGFLKKINLPVEIGNKQQIQGYLDLSNAPVGYVADVLVNMPESIINDYRFRLAKEMNCIDTYLPVFVEAEQKMLKSMIFDRIPKEKRVFKKQVLPFSQFEQQKVYDKVKVCREWLFNFDEMYNKLNN